VSAAFTPGADPVELTPVYRAQDDDRVAGGQGRTDDDLDGNAMALLWILAVPAGLGLGIFAATHVAAAADAIGAWCAS
jgi:hypothetical protein